MKWFWYQRTSIVAATFPFRYIVIMKSFFANLLYPPFLSPENSFFLVLSNLFSTFSTTHSSRACLPPHLYLLQHNTKEDCWIALEVDGDLKVLDVTDYVDKHPGGAEVIVEVAGQDWTVANNMFDDIGHTNEAKALMKTLIIGDLIQDPSKERSAASSKASGGGSSPIGLIMLIIAIIAGYYFSQQ